VTLSVGNEGAAIPNELLSSLFEPLQRGRIELSDSSRGQTSLGLGLFIVQEVALAHGGGVEVTSGEGRTTFTMRLAQSVEAQLE
jgi:signal transduction histidine kinase